LAELEATIREIYRRQHVDFAMPGCGAETGGTKLRKA
jgi:hypothetical protein